MQGTIHLNGMVFYGRHGALPEEATLGQRFIVDLALRLDIAAAADHDDLSATVNYAEVYSLCRDVVEGEPVKLIETVAGRILRDVLVRFPRVTSARVLVRKPSVPIAGSLDHAAVEAELHRA